MRPPPSPPLLPGKAWTALLLAIARCSDERLYSYERDSRTLCFRGTSSWREMRHELRHARVAHPYGGAVHKGFCDLYATVQPEIVRLRPATVCGYSLGAALAVLAAADLEAHGAAPCAVAAFACPRVGNEEFAHAYNERLGAATTTVLNTADFVTSVPLRLQHVGRVVTFRNATGDWLTRHTLPTYYMAMAHGRSDY